MIYFLSGLTKSANGSRCGKRAEAPLQLLLGETVEAMAEEDAMADELAAMLESAGATVNQFEVSALRPSSLRHPAR